MPLGTEVILGPGNVVLDGVAAFLPKRGTAPQFLTNVYSGQTAGWMKTPLGTEVDLDPDHIVLDPPGTQLPPQKRHNISPPFSAHVYCGICGHGRPTQLLLSSCLKFVYLCFLCYYFCCLFYYKYALLTFDE